MSRSAPVLPPMDAPMAMSGRPSSGRGGGEARGLSRERTRIVDSPGSGRRQFDKRRSTLRETGQLVPGVPRLRPRGREARERKCYKCGQLGHGAPDCPVTAATVGVVPAAPTQPTMQPDPTPAPTPPAQLADHQPPPVSLGRQLRSRSVQLQQRRYRARARRQCETARAVLMSGKGSQLVGKLHSLQERQRAQLPERRRSVEAQVSQVELEIDLARFKTGLSLGGGGGGDVVAVSSAPSLTSTATADRLAGASSQQQAVVSAISKSLTHKHADIKASAPLFLYRAASFCHLDRVQMQQELKVARLAKLKWFSALSDRQKAAYGDEEELHQLGARGNGEAAKAVRRHLATEFWPESESLTKRREQALSLCRDEGEPFRTLAFDERLFEELFVAAWTAPYNDKALDDVQEVLEEINPRHPQALRMQARFQRTRAARTTAVTGRLIEAAKSLYGCLQVCPGEHHTVREYARTVDDVRRDRPYPLWQRRLDQWDDPVRPSSPAAKHHKSHWDYVLSRVLDLFADPEDHVQTRASLLSNIDMLLSVYDYYVHLGSDVTLLRGGVGSGQFKKIEAKTIDLEHMDEAAAAAFEKMFRQDSSSSDEDEEAGGADSKGVRELKIVDRPEEIITLRQFRQLCLDCKMLCSQCQLADVGRIFLFSSREAATSETGGYELSEVQENDPHFGGNQAHVYEFIETIIRCANRIYRVGNTAHSSGRGNPKSTKGCTTLHQCFQHLLAEHLLPLSCSHDNTDALRWQILTTRSQIVLRKYKSSLEHVFRYFAVDHRAKHAHGRALGRGVGGASDPHHSKEMATFWRSKSKDVMDDTMSFNEILRLFDSINLTGDDGAASQITPAKLAKLYAHVTNDGHILSMVCKANESSEMVIDEFVEMIARIAVAHPECRQDVILGKKAVSGHRGTTIDEKINNWIIDTFLKCALDAMPRTVAKEFQAAAKKQSLDHVEDEEPAEVQRRREALAAPKLGDTYGDGQANIPAGPDTTGDGKI